MTAAEHVTISLITRVKQRFVGYAIATTTSDGADIVYVVERRGVDADQRRQALAAALESAVAAAETVNADVHLAVYTQTLRTELVQIGQRFGPVRVLLGSQIDTQDPTAQEAGSTLSQMIADRRAELEASELTEDPQSRPSDGALPTERKLVRVGTDGSFDRVHGGATYAWVADTGVHGYGTTKARTPLGAELAAIIKALQHASSARLEILTDSQEAVAAIYGTPLRRPLTSHESLAVDRAKYAIKRHRRATLTWVKGHSGVPLNDAADRLARLCRQATEFGTPAESVRHIAAGIVSVFTEAA